MTKCSVSPTSGEKMRRMSELVNSIISKMNKGSGMATRCSVIIVVTLWQNERKNKESGRQVHPWRRV